VADRNAVTTDMPTMIRIISHGAYKGTGKPYLFFKNKGRKKKKKYLYLIIK
jgi:hypothetical protein